MLQQETRIHQVVAALLVPVRGIIHPELDVVHTLPGGRLPGQAQLDLVAVNADDTAGGRDQPGDLHRHRSAAAPDVGTPHAR